jgi:hypothetical protein
VLECAKSGKTGAERRPLFQHGASGNRAGSGRGRVDPRGNERFSVEMRHALFLSDGFGWSWIRSDSTARCLCLP